MTSEEANKIIAEIEYWDDEDAEILNYTDEDEAIENIIDSFHPYTVPTEITIHGYVRKKVTMDAERESSWILEALLEHLDENYGGEDPTVESEVMKSAALKFVKNIFELYEPWQCEKITSKKIDTKKWVEENAQHWIDEGLAFKPISNQPLNAGVSV